MLEFIAWYVTITIIGLLTFPLAYRLLPALADRGYALSRSLGLLIWGFVFWLALSLGLAQNNLGGLLLALAVLVGLGVWANWKKARDDDWRTLLAWLKSRRGYVASVEILFFVAFALLAFIRANNPELTGTEKPMEIAFINAIIHSPTFPPHDPWLSGYAISYYYFGYVLAAMLAEITFTIGSVAFNLMLALVFALSAVGAYGLLYNLLQAYWQSKGNPDQGTERKPSRAIAGAFLAPLFLIALGNWEGLLEVLHKRGVGWTVNADGTFGPPGPFWTWLNMLDLKDVPGPLFGGILERLGAWWQDEGFAGLGPWFNEAFMPTRNWWWWRASRVVTDYDLRGTWFEVIDEFPAFSLILGDLHPHVLAMPFGLLVGALALNLYLGGWQGETNFFKVKLREDYEFELKFPVRLEGFVLLAVALGGLAFLNTWDFPIYLALVCGALLLALVRQRGWNWDLVEDFLKFSIPLAVLSVVLYLPFYIGFSSQAGGIVPNVIFPTRGSHLWIMFGGLFVPIFVFLAYLRRKENANWKMGFLLGIGIVLFLWAFSSIAALIVANSDVGQQLISSQGLSSTWDVLREATSRRLAFSGGLLTLLLLISAAAAYLTAAKQAGAGEEDQAGSGRGPSPVPFALMFVLFAGLLVLAPDFVYLRDQFGYRINTIFKFYYQAWALWSIAAAFAVAVLLSELRGLVGYAHAALVVLLIAIGLIYPVMGVMNKTNGFNSGNGPTLDGAAYLSLYSPDEYQAIQFLEQAPPGIVAEAVGDSYRDNFSVAATYSGQPTVLGWKGHESQWRGGEKEKGNREEDMRTLFTTRDWDQAQAILKEYDIRYVYLGPVERQTYGVDDNKFNQNLAKIYNQGQVVIYVVP